MTTQQWPDPDFSSMPAGPIRLGMREALQDALEFVEFYSRHWNGVSAKHPNTIATNARAALAAIQATQPAEAVATCDCQGPECKGRSGCKLRPAPASASVAGAGEVLPFIIEKRGQTFVLDWSARGGAGCRPATETEVALWAALAARPVADGEAGASTEVAAADVEYYRRALHEICEEWAGAECGQPVHAQEAYAIALAKRMYGLAAAALARQAPAPQPFDEGTPEFQALVSTIKAAALSQAVPAGFWLAPMEPDTAMIRAAHYWEVDERVREFWNALRDHWLARHPQPQAVTEDARDGERKSLSASVADALRPFLGEGERVIWQEPFRWKDDNGVMPNHFESMSLDALAADFGYTIVHDCGCAGIIRDEGEGRA